MRIAIGAFQHEANSFCTFPAELASFGHHVLVRGEQVLAEAAGTATETAGAVSVLARRQDVEIVPLLAAKASSSGPLTEETYRTLRNELLARLSAELPVDGVLLALHGAMLAEGEPDATGELLEAVRGVIGPDVPLVGTLDLHANVTQRMAHRANALVGYHTAPHVDLLETGVSAARILLGMLDGHLHPTMAVERLPLIVPAENARHNEGPLSDVIQMALDLERDGKALHASVFPVQPWLDIEDVGCATLVVTDGNADGAKRHAQRLAEALWLRRQGFAPSLVSADEAVGRALAGPERTVVFCDSADAPSSGATGDSTVILQALLRAEPFIATALLNVVDPQAVARAIQAGVGNEVTTLVGGSIAPNLFAPVEFTGAVKTISDGAFRFKGPGMRGVTHHMGRTVVLQRGSLYLVVMERGVTQWDPQLYRSLGLEPTDARIVQVKSPAAFRAAYGGIMDEVIIIRSPGAASPDLPALPWKHIRRPIYPLDPDTQWP
ncbi:MAG: M81 family metallopeptidase [Anaerolineae bacterium]